MWDGADSNLIEDGKVVRTIHCTVERKWGQSAEERIVPAPGEGPRAHLPRGLNRARNGPGHDSPGPMREVPGYIAGCR